MTEVAFAQKEKKRQHKGATKKNGGEQFGEVRCGLVHGDTGGLHDTAAAYYTKTVGCTAREGGLVGRCCAEKCLFCLVLFAFCLDEREYLRREAKNTNKTNKSLWTPLIPSRSTLQRTHVPKNKKKLLPTYLPATTTSTIRLQIHT